jgi:hypothetical protein
MRPIVQIYLFQREQAPPQRSMATKRGKNKPYFLVSRDGNKPELPRTLVLLNLPRKRVQP